MIDPYKVLGVSRDATDDDIKKAYRKLSRIYHPDANVNNANKEQAEEKFKQVQEAYKQIMHEREYGSQSGYNSYGYGGSSTGGYNQGGYDSYGSSGSYGSFEEFFGSFGGFGNFGGYYQQRNTSSTDDRDTLQLNAAENYINNRYYKEAMNVLNNIANKSARWYYLHALANAGLGNNVSALEDARTAANMEPGNVLYRRLVSMLEGGGQWYQSQGTGYGYERPRGSSMSCCWEFICLNCLCNCCCR